MRIPLLPLLTFATISACLGQGTISTFAVTPNSCSAAAGVQAITACLSPGGMVMDKLQRHRRAGCPAGARVHSTHLRLMSLSQ